MHQADMSAVRSNAISGVVAGPSSRRMILRVSPLLLAAATLAVLLDCPVRGSDTRRAAAPKDGRELRVLFLGNSLTSGNDLPGVVQAMAAAGGVQLHAVAVTPGGVSLEDHWRSQASRKALAGSKWDYVVLQQGPSSRLDSRANLQQYAVTWANEVRRQGATPALYMVWPFQGQQKGFELVSQSYRFAATASNARILPAGEAWQQVLRNDSALALYHSDRLHPTPAGTYLAALVITHGLTGVQPATVPARLKLPSGHDFSVPEDQAEKLRQAAAKIEGG